MFCRSNLLDPSTVPTARPRRVVTGRAPEAVNGPFPRPEAAHRALRQRVRDRNARRRLRTDLDLRRRPARHPADHLWAVADDRVREPTRTRAALRGGERPLSLDLGAFADPIGSVPLTDDPTFKSLLRKAGREDPVMRQIQDAFFDDRYFRPAIAWADEQGFVEALSGLVIYDSFIHSGSISG